MTRLILDGDDLIAHDVQDVEPILERNHYLRSVEQKSDWGRHIASIPNVILTRWLNEEYTRGNVELRMFTKEFNELVARKLKDPEWAFLRVDGPRANIGWGD